LVLSGATVLTKQDLDATQARGAEAPENYDSQEPMRIMIRMGA
jgi:hypothetical protein